VNHVLLIGFMGSGKSTVGGILADRLDLRFLDLDAAIALRAGMTVPEIFADRGEPGFRAFEIEELSALESAPRAVVACGGGVVVDDRCRALLGELGTVVYLRVGADEALGRIGPVAGRPLLAGGDPLALGRALLVSREPLYEAAADITVDTAGLAPGKVADVVAESL